METAEDLLRETHLLKPKAPGKNSPHPISNKSTNAIHE